MLENFDYINLCTLKLSPILYCMSNLSYDVVSGSEIMPCNKIDKALVVYRFSGNDVHNNIAYIMTKL